MWVDKVFGEVSQAESDLDWAKRQISLLQNQLEVPPEKPLESAQPQLSNELMAKLGISSGEVASISDFLLRAERFANEILANAKRDAEQAIGDAKRQAAEMVNGVQSRVEEIKRERLTTVDRIVADRQAQADAIAALTEDVRSSFESWREKAISWLSETVSELSDLSPLAPAPIRLEEIDTTLAAPELSEHESEAIGPPPSTGELPPPAAVTQEKEPLQALVADPHDEVPGESSPFTPPPPPGFSTETVPNPWTSSTFVPPPPDGFVVEEGATQSAQPDDEAFVLPSWNGYSE